MRLIYHLVNVFTRDDAPLSGNPLCVFENAAGINGELMQELARQFNLSETTFILPSTRANARVRIFTPDFEMPFAGHPTLGTAHVVRQIARQRGMAADEILLEMKAGMIPVSADGDQWTLTANPATHREVEVDDAQLARALGLEAEDIVRDGAGPRPLWVDTGSEQLLVPLVSPAAVRACAPNPQSLTALRSLQGRQLVLVFAEAGDGLTEARFMFEQGGVFREDPATGSACANLGGWHLATGSALPLARRVHQGDRIARPSTLLLCVDARRAVRVSGAVRYLGRGELDV
jgi:PhzF family phenazine biosynthesis protein